MLAFGRTLIYVVEIEIEIEIEITVTDIHWKFRKFFCENHERYVEKQKRIFLNTM